VANLRPFCRHLSLSSRVLGPVFVSSILRDAEGHRVSTPGYSKFTGRILAGKWGGYCILTGKKTVFISSGVITIRKVGIVRGDSRITISEEVIDSLDDTSIWKLKIYCHFLHFAKTEDIGLKCCMGARFLKKRSTGETVEKLFSIVNARFLGVSRPFITVRSLIVAHSVRSFFSASPPRICSGTFSTVSEGVFKRNHQD